MGLSCVGVISRYFIKIITLHKTHADGDFVINIIVVLLKVVHVCFAICLLHLMLFSIKLILESIDCELWLSSQWRRNGGLQGLVPPQF